MLAALALLGGLIERSRAASTPNSSQASARPNLEKLSNKLLKVSGALPNLSTLSQQLLSLAGEALVVRWRKCR